MLLQQFLQFVKTHRLFQTTDRLIIAVSGGVDSIVLCELCQQSGIDFVIAHCNFQLRGAESERDENFVTSLASRYKVPLFIKKFDTVEFAESSRQSIQEAARHLRYNWFRELALSSQLNEGSNKNGGKMSTCFSKPRIFIATAHHANDSVETMLMNFFKGTGIRGLQGIKAKQERMPDLIRPLVFAKKEDLLEFAIAHNLNYVEDSSNQADKYTRNYFRNQLIPALQKVYPQVEDNLMNNLERFSEIEMLYDQSIHLHRKQLLEYRGSEVHIAVLKLLRVKPLQTVLYEIIKPYGFTAHQSADAMTLLQSESGKYIQSPTHRVIRNRNWLIFTPVLDKSAEHYLIEANDRTIHFPGGELIISEKAFTSQLVKDSHTAQFDAASIQFPLLLRRWKQGDYFYPLGMQKKKKLSRFFIDQKLSIPQKENTWVIEMDKKIIWIVGMRIDNRFKITPETKSTLILLFKPRLQK